MSRINIVSEQVIQYHAQLQAEINLPALEELTEHKLKFMLERIYLFETRCSLKKIKYSDKQCVAFRGRIADRMLLMDNFDLQDAIANRDNVIEPVDSVA